MQNEAEVVVKGITDQIANCPCVLCRLIDPAMLTAILNTASEAARAGGMTDELRQKFAKATFDLTDKLAPEQSRAMKREGTRQTLPTN